MTEHQFRLASIKTQSIRLSDQRCWLQAWLDPGIQMVRAVASTPQPTSVILTLVSDFV